MSVNDAAGRALGGREGDGLLQLLLGPQVGGVAARLLPAVGGPADIKKSL